MDERVVTMKRKSRVGDDERAGDYFSDPEWLAAKITELFLTGESWVTAENRLQLSRQEFNRFHDMAIAQIQARLNRIEALYDGDGIYCRRRDKSERTTGGR